MPPKQRTWTILAAAGALTACAATGSQAGASSPLALFFGQVAPQVGDLAVEIQTARRVQALDPLVAKVHFDLTGANVPGTSSIDVARAKFENDKAIVRWSSLLPGPVTVKATLFDSGDRVLAAGSGNATIAAGTQATLLMTIMTASGSVLVTVDGALEATPTVKIGS
ncbi:MAG: hypothetical protein FJZ01_26465 [Candidatus Sericytochromatia bacterium]|nr:hypothetical protein [Candidatus Tanganyikabacteria bacterium]